MVVQTRRWQFTVADFARMAEAGIFAEGDRVELIDGEVRAMSPIGPRHAAIVKRLNRLIGIQVGDRTVMGIQDPVRLNDYTEPEPDISVMRPRVDFYTQAHPQPADVYFLVEVAEKSLEYDRDEKVPRFAEAGIPEVWLVDIEREEVTQYSDPAGNVYREALTLRRGDSLVSKVLSPLQLSVNEIFG